MVTIFFTYQAAVGVYTDPVVADYCILKAKIVSAVYGDVSVIWRDHAGLCFSQTSQDISAQFLDIVLC